jgi:hypothetical protein
MIDVQVLNESGFNEAIVGITLSHGASVERALEIAPKLALKDGGHNKFLESIMVWLDVRAPRYWWIQADTYRMSTKQSESTMHTILKRPLNNSDFSLPLSQPHLKYLNDLIELKQFEELKALLPEGFLQRRIWCLSYKTIRNIVAQRNSHKLIEWRDFCDAMVDQLGHPEFIALGPVEERCST